MSNVRAVEHTDERAVGEMLAVPGGSVAGAHRHPGQDERFEVLEGVLGYRRGDERGELGPGESVSVPAGVVTTGGMLATPTCRHASP